MAEAIEAYREGLSGEMFSQSTLENLDRVPIQVCVRLQPCRGVRIRFHRDHSGATLGSKNAVDTDICTDVYEEIAWCQPALPDQHLDIRRIRVGGPARSSPVELGPELRPVANRDGCFLPQNAAASLETHGPDDAPHPGRPV